MNKPVAVFFDIGDTLLMEAAYDLRSGVIALLQDARMRSFSAARNDHDAVASDLIRDIQNTQRTKHRELSVASWIRSKVNQGENEENNAVELERVLWEHTVTLRAPRGVRKALTTLKREKICLAAVSNAIFSAHILAKELDRHGLGSYLSFVLSSADIGHRKPSPIIFQEAISRANARPEAIWFVGDTWEEDILGAAEAGMLPIWMQSGDDRLNSAISHVRVNNWNGFARLLSTSQARMSYGA